MMIDPVPRYLHHQAGSHGPVMLVYHSVSPGGGTPDWRYAISMQRFRSHLDFLAGEGWATAAMSELALWDPERPAHPIPLTMVHLASLSSSGKDFGRKFDAKLDNTILGQLDEILGVQANNDAQAKHG